MHAVIRLVGYARGQAPGVRAQLFAQLMHLTRPAILVLDLALLSKLRALLGRGDPCDPTVSLGVGDRATLLIPQAQAPPDGIHTVSPPHRSVTLAQCATQGAAGG